MRVFVYFNLHKKIFSVKALEGASKGRVIAHANQVYLENATFKVSEAGRQRVLREKCKNVHAGVVGDWSGAQDLDASQERQATTQVTYNPYKYSSFVTKEGEQPVMSAKYASLNAVDRSVWIG